MRMQGLGWSSVSGRSRDGQGFCDSCVLMCYIKDSFYRLSSGRRGQNAKSGRALKAAAGSGRQTLSSALGQVGLQIQLMCSMPTDKRTMFSLTPALPVPRVELAVRGGGRMRGQRLGVADVDQAREQAQRVEKARPAARGSASLLLRPKDRMPEARPPIWRCASAWSGGQGSPA